MDPKWTTLDSVKNEQYCNRPTQKNVAVANQDIYDLGGGLLFPAKTIFICDLNYVAATYLIAKEIYYKTPDMDEFSYLMRWVLPYEVGASAKPLSMSFVVRDNHLHAVGTGYNSDQQKLFYYGLYDLRDFQTGDWVNTDLSDGHIGWAYYYPDIDVNSDGKSVSIVSDVADISLVQEIWQRALQWDDEFIAVQIIARYAEHRVPIGTLCSPSVLWLRDDTVYIHTGTGGATNTSLYVGAFDDNVIGGTALCEADAPFAQMTLAFTEALHVGFIYLNAISELSFKSYNAALAELSDEEYIGLCSESYAYGLTARLDENNNWRFHALWGTVSVEQSVRHAYKEPDETEWVNAPIQPYSETGYVASFAHEKFFCENTPSPFFDDSKSDFGLITHGFPGSTPFSIYFRQNGYVVILPPQVGGSYWGGGHITGARTIEIVELSPHADIGSMGLAVHRRGDMGRGNIIQVMGHAQLEDKTTIYFDRNQFYQFTPGEYEYLGGPITLEWESDKFPLDGPLRIFTQIMAVFGLIANGFKIIVTTDEASHEVWFDPADSGKWKDFNKCGRWAKWHHVHELAGDDDITGIYVKSQRLKDWG